MFYQESQLEGKNLNESAPTPGGFLFPLRIPPSPPPPLKESLRIHYLNIKKVFC